MINDLIPDIENCVSKASSPNILIGIDGGQGSGKSTLIRGLKDSLSRTNDYCIIDIETDDFLVERSKRENLPASFFEEINNLSQLFDFQKLSETVTLLAGAVDCNIKLDNLYNRATSKKDRNETKVMGSKNIILVGGPYLLSPLLPKFDLKFFINVDKEKRLLNTLQRVLENKSRTPDSQRILFDKFENFFKPYYTTRLSSFDRIINGNDFKIDH